ncbi:MAG: L-fucose isomerase [Fimbriimonadales bacterium]|nr:MAG: L-fucose isomerase [Fimbriimonadales bacterium]
MKVGVLTFTDGRERAAKALDEQCRAFQQKVCDWLAAEGHEAVGADAIAWNYKTAVDGAAQLADPACDAVIFNFCVWAYPDFVAQAARDLSAEDIPICFLGNINPAYPGWVAFFAACGTLPEFGVPHGRVLGDLSEPSVADQMRRWLAEHMPDRRAAGQSAAARLFGLRYGEFDGPSMGMYTGHIDPSQWMEQFGIHVFHRSQLTLAWLCDKVEDDRVLAGVEWLKQHCKNILWDEERLRDGLDGHLARQCRFYLAVKDYCKTEGIDFLGLTGQLDYTEWEKGITMDVPEALLNDTADWEEENKKPIICATECDSNGALTMQILHHLTGTPVLFADLRHYFTKSDIEAAGGKCEHDGVYDLVNSGQHAPWFSKRSNDFRENWRTVTLHPSIPMYFPCGGASVEFFADPAPQVTFARITRASGQFRMHILTGSFVRFGEEADRALAAQTTPEWPHAFATFDCDLQTLAASYASNHIHAVLGDWRAELVAACETVGIEPILLS